VSAGPDLSGKTEEHQPGIHEMLYGKPEPAHTRASVFICSTRTPPEISIASHLPWLAMLHLQTELRPSDAGRYQLWQDSMTAKTPRPPRAK
jgi:hypothetical protein